MGEMADFYLDSVLDEELWESPKQCYYCGRWGYHWVKTESGWRLEDDKGQIHTCREYYK